MPKNSDPPKSLSGQSAGDRSPREAAARDEALAWFVRLNSGDAGPAEQEAFGRWLRVNPMNPREYDRLETLWVDLDAVPDPRPALSPPRRGLTRRHLLAGAAGAAACAGVAVMSGVTVGDLEAMAVADFRTGTGERRTITAPDGTVIDMDAETAVAVEYGPAVRRLRLLSGRASFRVRHDPSRPFDVACAGGTVRALGTAFTVHRRAADTSVAVEESAVEVCLGAPGAGGDTVRLSAGERIAYGRHGLGRPTSAADDAETAWRRGKLVFRDRPLADVVADLNRYRPGRVVVWGDALAALRIDGVFNIDDPDAVLNAIVRTLPVREARITPFLVVLAGA